MAEKLNDFGSLPEYLKCRVSGKEVYLRTVYPKDFFRKYRGFAISIDILRKLNQSAYIIYKYVGATTKYYLTTVQAFFDSSLEYFNAGGKDLQKIVPLENMTLIEYETFKL